MAFTGLVAFVFAALISTASAAPRRRALCPDGVNSAINPTCCSFFAIRDALVNDIFEGICGEAAHSTVRIAFHDAIGFSLTDPTFGNGADGSMIAFQDTELNFPSNAGIDDIVGDLQPFADAHGLSYGDVIQFGSSVALTMCPGAPIVQTFVGRPNATVAAAPGTVPDPFEAVPDILARMADAGFSPAELIALLASHSVAAQDEIQPTINGAPFDSTPDAFDSQVFLEVLLKGTTLPGDLPAGQGEVASPLDGEFRLQSDFALARDPATACTWQSFVADQALMASSFAAAMGKLAVLGQDVNSLTDCTEVLIPAAGTVSTATIPAGKTIDDIEAACAATPFPAVPTAAGDPITVQRVPPQ